ncbi:MAG TPA: nucleoside deaminase [Burkholderiales bacterium]|nr:nucleoside deaminase [Burkholderiales bacterium]
MDGDDDLRCLRQAIDLARRSRASGNHPFGALIVGADGKVLAEAINRAAPGRGDATGHAELEAVRAASAAYPADRLRAATLYSSAEPCAMCAGAIYWAGIGRVVYGLSETRLLALTGSHPENPTLALPCREVFARGQRAVEVVGPLIEDEAAAVHAGFW